MQYRWLIGRLIYLTITTPELCHAVHGLSQFMQSPQEKHFEAAKRVLRYLKGTPGHSFWLRHHSDL